MRTGRELWTRLLALALLGSGLLALAAPPVAGPALTLRREPTGISAETRARTSLAGVLREPAAAVVSIYTSRIDRSEDSPLMADPFFKRFFGEMLRHHPQQVPNSLGSGVIVSDDGYILTNNHVVVRADEIKVAMPGKRQEYPARLVGRDPKSDLAVLKVDPPQPLVPIRITDSDKLEVGDAVFAIGNPFNLGQTTTRGIVSALHRGGLGVAAYENWIQTDASINPGNSGGALVDAEGRLVGINTAILSRTGSNQGIGFAIPINFAVAIMERLVRDGRIQRGELGITVRPVPLEHLDFFGLKEANGALVEHVEAGSAAAAAGLRAGDIILQVDGTPVKDLPQLQFRLAQIAPGVPLRLALWRDGQTLNLSASLREVPDDEDAAGTPPPGRDLLRGLRLSPLSPQQRDDLGAPKDVSGLLVVTVAPDTPAAAAGLQPKDIVMEVARQKVATLDDVQQAARANAEPALLLYVWTQGKMRYIVLKDRP